MIHRLDMDYPDYADPDVRGELRCAIINIGCKINDIIDYLNKAENLSPFIIHERKEEPKWKAGDTAWFISFGEGMASQYFEVEEQKITRFGSQIANDGIDTNYFKTRESAEACLEEIKEAMKRYE